jgi:hypothetical protein
MKSKKIFAGLVLAVFLFAIPQAVAQASEIQGTYSGQYQSTNPGTNGDICFSIDSEGNLDGILTVRGLDCIITLTKDNIQPQQGRIWYHGSLNRLGRNYFMRMCVDDLGNGLLKGAFRIPDWRFMANFLVSAVE